MSWSCEICGKGNGEDHSDCEIVKSNNDNTEAVLERLDTIINLLKEMKK